MIFGSKANACDTNSVTFEDAAAGQIYGLAISLPDGKVIRSYAPGGPTKDIISTRNDGYTLIVAPYYDVVMVITNDDGMLLGRAFNHNPVDPLQEVGPHTRRSIEASFSGNAVETVTTYQTLVPNTVLNQREWYHHKCRPYLPLGSNLQWPTTAPAYFTVSDWTKWEVVPDDNDSGLVVRVFLLTSSPFVL